MRDDYYEILQLAPNVRQNQVVAAFRRLARQHHPDKQADGQSDTFALLREAYDVLSDPVSRQRYDERLRWIRCSQPQWITEAPEKSVSLRGSSVGGMQGRSTARADRHSTGVVLGSSSAAWACAPLEVRPCRLPPRGLSQTAMGASAAHALAAGLVMRASTAPEADMHKFRRSTSHSSSRPSSSAAHVGLREGAGRCGPLGRGNTVPGHSWRLLERDGGIRIPGTGTASSGLCGPR